MVLADFSNVGDFFFAGSLPIAAGDSAVSPIYDCLTPVFRGRSEATTAIADTQGWVRGLGVPGALGPAEEVRIAATTLDVAMYTTKLCSLLVEWMFRHFLTEQVGASYRLLPVKGNAAGSLENEAVIHLQQSIRVATPWVRFTLTNEDSVNIDTDDVMFHAWLRGG